MPGVGAGAAGRRTLSAEAVEVVYDGMLRDLEDRMPGLLARREEQTAVARGLRERLLAAPVEERHGLAATAGFRELGLVDLLLVDSWQLQPAEPARSEARALLALRVAEQFREPRLAGRVNDLKARAFVLIASARRLVGDRREAEDGFGRAVALLTCPPDALERGFYCQQLAALRREQGREDEATGLLWRAALVYNENADLVEEGACLAELGFLFLAEDQPHRAVLPLSRACEVLGLHRDASLAVRARLSLALCEAILGHEAKAVRLLKTTRPCTAGWPIRRFRWPTSPGWRARWRGSPAARSRRWSCWRGPVRDFLAQRSLYEVALTSLDLVAARAKAGRLESVLPLIEDVVEAFPADLGQAGVLLALGSVETAILAEGRGVGRPSSPPRPR